MCAKIRAWKSAGKANGTPIVSSFFGKLNADGKGGLVNAELELGRDWRRKLLAAGAGAGAGAGQGSGDATCPSYRAERATYVPSIDTHPLCTSFVVC